MSSTQFVNSNPDWMDLYNEGRRKWGLTNAGPQKGTYYSTQLQNTVNADLNAWGATGLPIGLTNLNDILLRRGKTDPAAMNRNLREIGRSTDAQVQANEGSFAGRGLQNAGLKSALNAAIGAAGADREAAVRANETQTAEARQRDDLRLLLDMIIGPGVGSGATNANASAAQDAAKKEQQTALLMTLATLAASSCWVARSVYGAGDPRWLMARHYVQWRAPRLLRRAYLRYGERFAGWLDAHAWAKPIVKPFFDYMVWRSGVQRCR